VLLDALTAGTTAISVRPFWTQIENHPVSLTGGGVV
jgi:hypothetical protein